MKKIILLTFLILISSLFVNAENTYPHFGGENLDYFSDDQSLFNQNLETSEIADLIAINDPQFMPLVEDLDGDGNSEIIVLGGGTLGIYQAEQTDSGVELNSLSGFLTTAIIDGNYYSNIITYDIDSDTFPEVIFYSIEIKHLFIINWNGSHSFDTGYDWDIGSADGVFNRLPSSMIGCGDSNGCILINPDRDESLITGQRTINATQFDQYSENQTTRLTFNYFNNPNARTFCLPKYKSVPYGNSKYYATYSHFDTLRLSSFEINSTEHIIENGVSNAHTHESSPLDCQRGVSGYTSPTLLEFSIDNNLEVGYAYQHDDDEFKLIVYNEILSEVDEFPEITLADGVLISNPFVTNAYSDSSESSLCVTGYNSDYGDFGRLNILCADYQSSFTGFGQNNQFTYDLTSAPDYNITEQDFYSVASHSIESSQTNSISEILTPQGILKFEDIGAGQISLSCFNFELCEAELIYDIPIKSEISIISVDATNQGFEDLIALSETNLYYIDDGFFNQNAYLGYCTKIEPSIDAVWKLSDSDSNETINSYVDNINKLNGTSTSTEISLNNYDGSSYSIIEVHDGSGYVYNFDFIIDSPCNGDTNILDVSFYGSDSSSLNTHFIKIFNYATGEYDILNIGTYPFGVSTEYNYSFNIQNIINYMNGSTNLTIKFIDNPANTDNSQTTYQIDKLSLICSSIIEGNTSNEVRIRAKPIDPEGDLVSARAVLYHGELNSQDTGWSQDFASGTEIPLSGLIPNELTSGSTLRIYYRDSLNYLDDPNFQDFTFIVQNSGHLYYESNSCQGLTDEEFEDGVAGICDSDSDCPNGYDCISETCTILPSVCDKNSDCPTNYICGDDFSCESLPEDKDNAITDGVKGFSATTGIPLAVLVLIIFGAMTWGIFKEPSIQNNVKVPTIIILGLIVLGVSVILGFINFIWIVLLILAIVGVIALLVAKALQG